MNDQRSGFPTVTTMLFGIAIVLSPDVASATAVHLEDGFDGPALDSSLWRPYLQNPSAQVTQEHGSVAFVSRGGLDSVSVIPSDFEMEGAFRFEGSRDHFRIAWRTDQLAFDSYGERNGILAVIDQGGQVMLAQSGKEVMAIVDSFHGGGFATGSTYPFRITNHGEQVALYIGDLATPLLTGASSFSAGSFLTLYNRELLGTRLELDYLRITTVPEEMTLLPAGLALVLMGAVRRKLQR